ncbi:unnamed protein product, partial [Prunus brigantina]
AKKYLKKEGFLEVAKKTAHSSAWKAILDARSVLHKVCNEHLEMHAVFPQRYST